MSQSVPLTDLGECGAFVGQQDRRCHGRLVVAEQVGCLVEAVCDVCGEMAARPVKAIRPDEPEQPSDERWYERW